jgi:hypothetical protein
VAAQGFASGRLDDVAKHKRYLPNKGTCNHRCLAQSSRDIPEHWPRRRFVSPASWDRAPFQCWRSNERNTTSALNFASGKCLKDGIGSVGLIIERSMPRGGSIEPT